MPDSQSPEQVALDLVKFIALAEGRIGEAAGHKAADAKWIFSTYRDALAVTRGEPTTREKRRTHRTSATPPPPPQLEGTTPSQAAPPSSPRPTPETSSFLSRLGRT